MTITAKRPVAALVASALVLAAAQVHAQVLVQERDVDRARHWQPRRSERPLGIFPYVYGFRVVSGLLVPMPVYPPFSGCYHDWLSGYSSNWCRGPWPGRFNPVYKGGYWGPPVFLEEPVRLTPLSVELAELGDSYFRDGRHLMALDAYSRAWWKDQQNTHALVGRLVSSAALGKRRDASRLARKMVQKGISLPVARSEMLSLCAEADAALSQLIERVEEAGRDAQDDKGLGLLIAYLHATVGSPDRAEGLCREYLASDPLDRDVRKLRRLLRRDWGADSLLHRLWATIGLASAETERGLPNGGRAVRDSGPQTAAPR